MGPAPARTIDAPRRRRYVPTFRDAVDALWSLLTTSAALAVAFWLIDGARSDGLLPFVVVGALVGLGDVLLRPLLRVMAVVAGAVGALISGVAAQVVIVGAALWVVPGVEVDDWSDLVWVLVLTAVVMSVGRWLIGANDSAYVLGDVLRRSRSRARMRSGSDGGGPGLLMIQLDGVSKSVLDTAIEAGLAPTMSRWVTEGSHRLAPWWAQIPSTTPASQAGMLHGDSDQIPAFRWWDKQAQRLIVTNHPTDTAAIQQRLSNGNGLLAENGVAVSTMFTGDAPTSLLVMSTAGQRRGIGPGSSFLRFFASPFVLTRAVALSIAEMVKALYQTHRQRVRNVEPRVPRRASYVFLRGGTNALLRYLNLTLVAEHLQRRAPVIFVDLVDYDEIAHHAGPTRPEALRSLEGLDGVVGLLEKVAADSGRNYHIVVLSDHGQSLGATFEQVEGRELADVVRSLLDEPDAETAEAHDGEEWGPVNTLLTSLFKHDRTGKPVVFGPDRDHDSDRDQYRGGAAPELAVIASGNLGLAWFPRLPGRVTLEQILERWPRLIQGLVARPAIGVVVVETSARGPVAIGPDGVHFLRDGTVEGIDPLIPYAGRARSDLLRAAQLANTGDLLVVSAIDAFGHVHAFEEQVGSHGGLGGLQNEAMLLYPAELGLDESYLEDVDGRRMLVGAEAVHRQLLSWLTSLGLHQ